MLISEVEPIDEVGINLLNHESPKEAIDGIIELPLRKACEIFRRKGIETVMSSANKSNVLKQGEKPKEKEDVYPTPFLEPTPLFDEAGKGYAWIMLNFNTLSDENKDWLFSLEERTGPNGQNIGGKAIWFVHPCEMGTIEFQMKIGKFDYNYLKTILPEEEIPKNVKVDEKLIEFEKRHIVLGYNFAIYPTETVVLRMPVNEQTTVEEVEKYFSKFAESFKNQTIEKKIKRPEESEGHEGH